MHSKKTLRLGRGDVFAVQSAGGAGYGNPRERDPRAVRQDVLDGYVSPECAREQYRFAVDVARGVVDEAATRRLRAQA